MGPDALDRLTLVRGDITDSDAIDRAIGEHGVTHVIHLAALQVPFCRADPVRGAEVNVVGTACLFEAVRRRELGRRSPGQAQQRCTTVRERVAPTTIYGVYKLANEEWPGSTGRSGVASVGCGRSASTAQGRDQGLTSEPTHAMAAAARGEPYAISFGGRTELRADVARASSGPRASRMPRRRSTTCRGNRFT